MFVFPLREEEEEGCFLESSSSILLPSPFFSAMRFCSCIAIAAAACPSGESFLYVDRNFASGPNRASLNSRTVPSILGPPRSS